MSKISQTLIPKILKADDRQKAIDILHEIFNALHLNGDYASMMRTKEDLDSFSRKFSEMCKDCLESNDIDYLVEKRMELNFLYRDIVDTLSHSINLNKIKYEEGKTVQRGESILALKENEDLQSRIQAKGASTIRDIVGLDDSYKEFVQCVSLSYANYKQYEGVLTSIRLLTDSLASKISHERTILMKDAK